MFFYFVLGGGPEDEVMVVGEEASNAAPEEGAAAAASAKNGPSSKPAISSNINNIMGGMESTAGVKLHNHRRKLRQRSVHSTFCSRHFLFFKFSLPFFKRLEIAQRCENKSCSKLWQRKE